MYHRTIETELLDTAKHYPVVGMMGPRQSGKTTAVRKYFPHMPYENLEIPDVRLFAKTYNHGFIRGLTYFKKLAENRVLRSYLVYTGEQTQNIGDVKLINYRNVTDVYHEENRAR